MDNPLEKHAPRVNALRSHLYATNDERIILEIADYAAALQAERDMLARALQRVALDDTDAVRHNAGLIEAAKAQRERAAALQAELRLVRETCKINQRDYEAMQAELATIKEIDALNKWHYKDAERQLDECQRELHEVKAGTWTPVEEGTQIRCGCDIGECDTVILDDIEAVLELARAAQVIDLGGVKHRVAEWLKEQRKLTAAPEPPITQEALENFAYAPEANLLRSEAVIPSRYTTRIMCQMRDEYERRVQNWPSGPQAAEQLARAVNEVRDAEGVRDGARSYPWESLTERERKLGLKRAAAALARLNDAPQSQPSAAQAFAEIRDEFGHLFDGVTDADMREWRGHAPEGGVDAET